MMFNILELRTEIDNLSASAQIFCSMAEPHLSTALNFQASPGSVPCGVQEYRKCDLQCEGFKKETRPIPPRFLGGHLTELRFTENRVCDLRYSDLGLPCA